MSSSVGPAPPQGPPPYGHPGAPGGPGEHQHGHPGGPQYGYQGQPGPHFQAGPPPVSHHHSSNTTVVVMPGSPTHPPAQNIRDWSTGLCDCCADIGTCKSCDYIYM